MSKLGRALDAVGGSDIAAIRGEDDRGEELRQTPREIWRRIVHGVERPDKYSLFAELGNAAEEVVCTDYCIRHGLERTGVQRTVEVFLSDAEPYFRGELDLYVPQWNCSVDSKLVLSPASVAKFGPEGTDHVSNYILNQQTWYNIVGKLDYSVVCAIIYGNPVEYPIARVPAFESLVLADVRRFWNDHVVTKTPPAPIVVSDVLWDHPEPKAGMDKATEEEYALVAALRELKAQASEHDAKVEKAKAAVCEAIGEREGLWLGGKDRITWKADKNGNRRLVA